MDMKKILQALDTASSKPVEGSNDMKKFLSVVTEGANPHKVTLPVQMAMQHYSEPKVEKPKTIKEVKKSAMSGLLHQYYTEAQEEVELSNAAEKAIISEQARKLAERVLAKESRLDELSKDTLRDYVKANKEDSVQRASSDSFKSGKAGDKYNKADETHKDKMREKGMDRALSKLSDPDYDKKKDVNESLDNPTDRVSMDVPLLLRVMEYAREDAKTDMDLHFVLERLTKLSAEGQTLTMGDYDTIVGAGVGTNESRYGSRDAYQRDYDSSRTGFGRREREDDEYHNDGGAEEYTFRATIMDKDGNEMTKAPRMTTTKGRQHALNAVHQHYVNAGYSVVKIV